MALAGQALWIIERNLELSMSLDGIAAACGVSRSHLAYAFGTATGLSVMKYVRGRRLSQAARTLAEGAPDILSVALQAGYNSHEAFTRAFREQFGMTPEAVRDGRDFQHLKMVEPIQWRRTDSSNVRPPRIEKESAVLIVGLSENCSFESVNKIPGLWQRFMSQYYAAIPAKLDRIPVGVSHTPDAEGAFEYVCGVEVSSIGSKPKDLVVLELPPRTYAVFEHSEHISKVTDTYRRIWNEALPALGRAVADAPVLERHNRTFDPRTGEGGIQLWVPLSATDSGG